MQVTWAQFKSIVDAWNAKNLIRFVPKGGDGTYLAVWMQFEGQLIEVAGGLNDSADITAFEAGYKPSTSTTWFDNKNVYRDDDAISIDVAASGVTTKTYRFTANSFIWGGELIIAGTDVVDGDYCQLLVTDEDNLFGAGAGFVIREVIHKKFIPPSRVVSMQTPNSFPTALPAGLYFKFIYTEVNGVAKTANVNINKFS